MRTVPHGFKIHGPSEQSAAYFSGRHDAHSGKAVGENPYHRFTDLHDQWWDGYRSARYDRLHKDDWKKWARHHENVI